MRMFLILILFFSTIVHTQSLTDSLETELNKTTDVFIRINLLNELSYELIWQDADSAKQLSQSAVKLSTENNYDKGLASAYRNLSLADKIEGNFPAAIAGINKSISIFERVNDTIKLAQSYKDLGDIYHSQGDNEQTSVEYLLKAIRLSETAGADKITAACYNNLALAYRKLEDYGKAASFLVLSIELKKKLGNIKSLVYSYVNMGIIYAHSSHPDKAIEFYNKALQIAEDFDNKVHIAAINNNLSLIYKERKEFGKAKQSILAALRSFREINDGVGISISYYNLAELEKERQNYNKGMQYVQRCLEKALEIDAAEQLLDAYKILYELYSNNGKFKEAFEYLSMYKEKSDSVFNEQKHEQIADMQTKYETEKKVQQIELLEKEQLLSDSIIEKQSITIYSAAGILIISIVFSVVVYRQYKMTLEANKELVKKNLELMKSENSLNELNKEPGKYSDKVKQEILDKLNKLIKEEKIFKTPKLSIDSLAKQLNTNRTYLSEIINEVYDSNFNQFINAMRVIEARKMLIDPEFEICTIEAIAGEVGFSSKSVFHKSFKQFTGISPSFFRKNAIRKSA